MYMLQSDPTRNGTSILMRFLFIAALLLFSPIQASSGLGIGANASALIRVGSATELSNSTLSIPDPPEPFAVAVTISGPPLHKTACLLNTVNALRAIALGGSEARIADDTEYKFSDYPEVSIIVNTPKRKRSIQAEYVLRAIFVGVRDIISYKKFEFSQFEMTWNGQLMGWVHVVNNPTPQGLVADEILSNATGNVENRSLAALPLNSTHLESANNTNLLTTTIVNDPDEARLTIDLVPNGAKLGIYDIFFPVIQALSEMTFYKATAQAQGLVAGYDGTDGIICILTQLPFRSEPPFLEYRWLIRALARIPAYAVETHWFGELKIKVFVDGIEVGYGRLSNISTCSDGVSSYISA